MVLEVADLVGTQIHCYDDVSDLPPRMALVVALPGVPGPGDSHGPRWVRVGNHEDADILLPQQANILAALLADPSVHTDRGQGGHPLGSRCLMVASPRGGTGTSTAALRLARAAGAVLLDASGHPPVPREQESLHWGMIDPADPPLPTDLLRHLPHVDGVRQLRAMPGDAVNASDSRVAAVTARSPCPVVIDAGVWDRGVDAASAEIAAGGTPIRSVLISRGDEESALRLAGVLAAVSALGMPQSILGVGKPLEALRQVAEHFGVPVTPLPGGGHPWRAVWQSSWSN